MRRKARSIRQYPKRIKVRCRWYKVVFVNDLGYNCNGRIVGACDDVKKVIELVRDQPRNQMEEVFRHEWLHAIEREYRIKIPHHKVLDPLAKALWALERDNPNV